MAATVAAAAGSATLIGDPDKYGHLGYPVLAGPQPRKRSGWAASRSALTYTAADWNLVLACDMPAVTAEFLRDLLDAAERAGADALLPEGASGRLEPLSAVYHRRCLATLRRAIECGHTKDHRRAGRFGSGALDGRRCCLFRKSQYPRGMGLPK